MLQRSCGVHDAAGDEVGQQVHLFTAQRGDAGIAQFDKVVWQDAAGKTHGDAFHALREQQRELHRQRHGLLVATVVGGHPFGDLRAEDDIQREFGQAGFDVSRSSGVVAGEGVAPVALGVDEQVLLAQLNHGIANGGIAMRMIFHRVPDDVRHLVVTAVFQLVHAVQDAAVHRLQAVIDVRHGALKDDVAGVIEKPVAIERVHRLVLHRGGGWQDGGIGVVSGFFGGLFGHGAKGEKNRGRENRQCRGECKGAK